MDGMNSSRSGIGNPALGTDCSRSGSSSLSDPEERLRLRSRFVASVYNLVSNRKRLP